MNVLEIGFFVLLTIFFLWGLGLMLGELFFYVKWNKWSDIFKDMKEKIKEVFLLVIAMGIIITAGVALSWLTGVIYLAAKDLIWGT